ncbi:unnamed protein product [Owenia fusiformis]|uniref:RNA ligase 1 n=1 Tax=Owenia fusiformis TaxID=6347 RepID=A0A8J1UMX7_OWEFU|nr:unnamed protein product [Owenia fusiformis]
MAGSIKDSKHGSVQQKMPCLYQTVVIEEESSKRSWQPYRVVASENIRQAALDSNISSATGSEKFDGTCVYVHEFHEKPWLWARHDSKPNKAADKRFKKFQASHRSWMLHGKPEAEPTFKWNIDKDFKEIPKDWIPAEGVRVLNGRAQPDDNGHIPGWVPIDPTLRTHLWHLSVVDLEKGLCITLQSKDDHFEITFKWLSDFLGQTLELIGTNVNANPYGLGSKEKPIHVLVPHGAIGFSIPPPQDYSTLKEWFVNDPEGQVEGVVWLCTNGNMFKVHRHHLDLKWPIEKLCFNNTRVLISTKFEDEDYEKPLFTLLKGLNGYVVDSVQNI